MEVVLNHRIAKFYRDREFVFRSRNQNYGKLSTRRDLTLDSDILHVGLRRPSRGSDHGPGLSRPFGPSFFTQETTSGMDGFPAKIRVGPALD
jgi:hypothetical protein